MRGRYWNRWLRHSCCIVSVDLLILPCRKTTDCGVSLAALDVLGSYAKLVYGHQWNKMLALIYEGVTVGLGNGKLIGGESAEGIAARVRVQLEVERLMVAG